MVVRLDYRVLLVMIVFAVVSCILNQYEPPLKRNLTTGLSMLVMALVCYLMPPGG